MENRILSIFILVLVGLGFSPLQLKAQFVNNGAQVTIVNTGVLYVDGDLINLQSISGTPNFSSALGTQIIVTGNLVNNSGTEFFFSSDSSLVVMKGSSLQLIQGTDSVNFFRLKIENTSDSVRLERSISVIDSMMMQSGYVNLNGKDINLNTTGYLTGETGSTFIFGDSGTLFLERPIAINASPENIGGLGAAIQSNSNLGLTTITRSHETQNVAGVTAGFRYFEITPSFPVTDQTLVFNYFDHELNSITENDLQLYYSLDNGQTWTIQNASMDTTLNTLSDTTSQFPALYTLADDVCKLNPLVVNLGNDTSLCIVDSITLNALNSGSDFIWSTNDTSATIKVAAGSYSVTVTSAAGCIGIDTILIIQNAQPIVQTSNDSVICSGQPLTIGDLNTQLPNTNSYLWNTGATTQTISINTAIARVDTFIYTVTTPAGCSITDSIEIDINDQPVVNLGNDTTLCQTEILTLNATNAGATYLWSTGVATATIQINSTSIYTVAVANGICQAMDTVEVIKSNLISTIQKTDINCNGNTNGTAEITGLNGIPSYTYVWNNAATTKVITNLATGNYFATITDSIGCTVASDTVIILEPTDITLSFATTNESCVTGNDGAIDLTATGGTGALSFNWAISPNASTISTNEDLSSLNSGTYIVTVTDANSCTKVDSLSVIRPNGFTAVENFTNISCNGANDASVNYSLTGGAAPFTFAYSNGSTDSIQANLSAGTYSVLIQDANNCNYHDTITVVNPSLITSTLAGTNLTCFNNGNGAINLTPNGGIGAFTFNWTTSLSAASISTNEDLTSLATGNYKVTITDANDCLKLDSVIITEPVVLTSNLTANAVSCNGSSDGSISSSILGGTQPYTYLWSTSTSSATISTASSMTSLIAGNYLVTINDANGCQILDAVLVTEPTVLALTRDSAINVSCFGLSNGSAFTSISGGSTPYTYSWTISTGSATFATTDDVSNLSPGTYQLMVTDVNGCQDSINTTITEPAPLTSSINATNISCNSGNDGSIDLTTNGGTSPYTYLWSTSTSSVTIATTEDLANVIAGNYKVIITDANGCQKLDSVIITEPTGIALSITGTNVSCNNSMDGSADLTVIGGTQPYTYNWSTSISSVTIATTEDISLLGAANYIVTVTDANGCQKFDSVVITEPTVLDLAIDSFLNVSCFGLADGSVFTSTSGGVTPYNFSWTISTGSANFATTDDISNLNPGSYQLMVTDANGCQDAINTTITEPVLLTSSINATNVSCNSGNDGNIDLTTNGGTNPYTYLWSTSTSSVTVATTEDLANVIAGNYKVTITDANGCQKLDSVNITQPAGITLSIAGTNVSCYNGSNGIGDLTVTGGITPYTYLWSPSTGSATIPTTATNTGLMAGTYSVTVTDANSCSKIDSITITQPDSLTIMAQVSNVTCFGTSTGAIDLTVTGGTSTYSYTWSTSTNSATISLNEDLSNVPAGTYQVTITDLNSCSKVASFTITENSDLVVSTSVVPASCNQSTGSSTVVASGGITPYTYLWTGNGVITPTNTNLTAGNYTVIVTDGLGCQDSAVASVGNSSGPSITLDNISHVNCFGDSSGVINVSINGGATPYVYAWNTSASTEDIATLSAGTYNLNVTDNNNCVAVQSYTITQGDSIQMALLPTHVSCYNATDGSITSNLIGGSSPFTYSWSNLGTTANLNNLDTGLYILTIQDSLACTATDSVQISQPDSLQPTFVATDVTCNGLLDGSIDLTVIGGTIPYTYNWSTSTNSTTIGITQNISNFTAATYLVTITDGNNCSIIDSAIIEQPMPLVYTDSVTQINCGGDSTGAIILTVSGGTIPYTYNWSNGDTTATIDTLSIGVYGVTITDNNNCSLTNGYTLTQPTSLSLFVSSTDITCNGLANGTAATSTTGGSGPMTFVWTNSTSSSTIATTASVSNLSVDRYYVTATDSLGCSQMDSVDIVEPTLMTSLLDSTDLNCNGDLSGSIDLTVTGGTIPYAYNWSTSTNATSMGTTQDISTLAAATYLVTITDGNSCTIIDSTIVGQPMPLAYTDSVTLINCGGDSSGAVILTVSGGTIPYSYNWSNGDTTATIDTLNIGVYGVTITDDNSCSLTSSYTITQPTALSLFVSSTDITCNGLANGTAAASTTGGSGPKTFSWNNSSGPAIIATTASISSLSVDRYYVTATDSLGCSQIDSVDVLEPTLLTSLLDSTDLGCNGDFSGSTDLTVSGGKIPYTFNWSTSTNTATIAITEDVLNLAAATYLVTITDGNNCQIIDSTIINQPDTIAISASIQEVLCAAGSSGTIALTVSGGTPLYSYSWLNSASTDSISGLIAGTYAVTVSDINSCSETATYQITEPTALSVLLSASTVNCGGDSTGMITSVVNGGVTPYSYSWSTSTSAVIISTADSIQNLFAGTYYVTVTDTNGCQLIDTAEVNQNTTLLASISKTDISCNGSANGEFNLTVSGGTTPYSYLWNDLSTSQNRNNLNAGIYLVTVSDNLGCSVELFDTIVEPSIVIVVADTNNVTCSGAGDAFIKLFTSGGAAPYSYNWSNAASTDSIGDLAGGTYLVTITDMNSCTTTKTFNLTNPDPIELNTIVSNIGCGASANGGSIRLDATGGTIPYIYNWTNAATTAFNDSLGVGSYSVTLTDASGCVSSANFTIQLEGNPIFARYLSASSATTTDTLSFVNLSYPSPANYNWDMGDSTFLNQTNVLHSYEFAETINGDSSYYNVRLIADNGTCVDSVNKKITILNVRAKKDGSGNSNSGYEAPFIEKMSLYPVPARDVLNYKLLLGLEDEMTVQIHSINQKLVKTFTLSKSKEHEGTFGISDLARGVYIITFYTGSDQQSIRFVKM